MREYLYVYFRFCMLAKVTQQRNGMRLHTYSVLRPAAVVAKFTQSYFNRSRLDTFHCDGVFSSIVVVVW